MGKPKKTVRELPIDKKLVKEILGKKVLFIGFLGAIGHCHFCGKSFKKRMVSEYKGNIYCNEDCIKMGSILENG